MSTATVQPVPSGLAYVVVDVDGHAPRTLDDFTGATKQLLLRRGRESAGLPVPARRPCLANCGSTRRPFSGRQGRRFGSIKNGSEGTFYAEALSIF